MTVSQSAQTAESAALDARAAADYAIAYAEAEDLIEDGEGAVERIRAAPTVAISLKLTADELEDHVLSIESLRHPHALFLIWKRHLVLR
jgi:hypothetical protein